MFPLGGGSQCLVAAELLNAPVRTDIHTVSKNDTF
jgi:hypothetical protein